MIKTLLSAIGEYKKDSLLTMLYTALEVFLEILIPFSTAAIIDRGIAQKDMHSVILFGTIMVILAFLSLFSGFQAGKYAASASSGYAMNLREKMFWKVQTYSFSNIDKFSTAGLITRMTTDVTNMQNAYQMMIRIAIRSPLMLISCIIMSFVINRDLSLVFIFALILLAIVLCVIMKLTLPIFNSVFAKYDELNASVQENVGAIRVVKAFVREDYEKEKFRKATDRLYKMFVKAESILSFNNPVMMLAVYGCIVMLSWKGAHFIVEGKMTTGNLTSLFSYVIGMMMSLMMLSMVFVMISMSMASARRISEILNEEPEMKNPENPLTEVPDGSIDFDHVSFSYKKGSDKKVLEDINIHIKSGETIGIIGGTGSGKSSLVSLISRLYDVTEGAVSVGGKDVRLYDIEALRNQVSVVLQKNTLFSGTILENLRWGKKDATEEECRNACRAANADEFIERFEKKYETYIEQGGSNVSGGQRQRLCIARALLKKPKILILDDSTSAVDTATDKRIREAFRKYIPGTTKIIISQRISSVEDADRIIVLDEGKINGFDTHTNLLKTNKIYREIADAQKEGNGDFDHQKE